MCLPTYLFLSGSWVSRCCVSAAGERREAGPGSESCGDSVRAFRSSGGGIGLIRLALRPVESEPVFCESGDPESEERVGGEIEDGREDEAEDTEVGFLTERSSGWSWTGAGLRLLLSSSISDSLPTSISSSLSVSLGSRLTEAAAMEAPRPGTAEAGTGNLVSVKAALNIWRRSYLQHCPEVSGDIITPHADIYNIPN